jgi:hypothetical protein
MHVETEASYCNEESTNDWRWLVSRLEVEGLGVGDAD